MFRREQALLVSVLFFAGCGAGDFAPVSEPGDAMVANATVVEVIDGDTLRIEFATGSELVRLLGVDTPETVDPNRPAQCFGSEASTFLADALPAGTGVQVLRDQQARDKFGRLLGYVHRASDAVFVNYEILSQGFGETLSIEPNTTFAQEFRSARNDARAGHRGLWGHCDGPDQPLTNQPPGP